MARTLKSVGALALGLVLLGGKSWADPPVKPSTERKLSLPEKSYHYADIELPAHFKTPAARRFDNTEITSDRTAKALAQFLRSLVSYQSKYDEGLAKARVVRADFDNFTREENRGKTLFLDRCASCHLPGGQSAHFFMDRPRNNGLDADIRKTDGGV